MQTQDKSTCGMCGRAIFAGLKSVKLFDLPVHEECSKSFNQKRLNAVVIDIVIAMALLFVIGMSLRDGSSPEAEDGNGVPMPALALCIAGGFLLLRDAWRGISPGKALCGLQVVDADTDAPISALQSMQRNVILLACLSAGFPASWGPVRFVSVSLWGVAFRMRGGPRDGEGWARTRVIDRKLRSAPVFTAPDLDRIRKRTLAA